jgi:hypothetical protein
MLIVDDTFFVLAFNFTKQNIEKCRSFGVRTRDMRLLKEAAALFEADSTRQPYVPGHDRFVVSPENSRRVLGAFIKDARKELLIYDDKVTDRLMVRALQERQNAGVQIRIIGKADKKLTGVEARKMPDIRTHLRAIIRDGSTAFLGSQSLRKLELDGRRELGINDGLANREKMQAVFETDWADAKPRKSGQEKAVDEKDVPTEAAAAR